MNTTKKNGGHDRPQENCGPLPAELRASAQLPDVKTDGFVEASNLTIGCPDEARRHLRGLRFPLFVRQAACRLTRTVARHLIVSTARPLGAEKF